MIVTILFGRGLFTLPVKGKIVAANLARSILQIESRLHPAMACIGTLSCPYSELNGEHNPDRRAVGR